MVRILGSTGSRRRRRYQLGALVSLVALLAVLAVPNALAVHDIQMQLDGDVSASTGTSVGGSPQPLDWDSLFDTAGTPFALPVDFTASGFDRDFLTNANGSFNTSDLTTFATGSKDTLPITPGWQCNVDNNVNSKIDVMNAYAAAFTNPADGHDILYFALERNANTGDANVAFWFLQDDVDCVSTGGSAPFTGDHVDGDLLVVSAFTKGGGVSTIDVYRWNGGAGGSLGTTSVAHGVDCKSTLGGDSVCATTNSGTLPINTSITTPWPTSNKQDGPGNTLREAEFFEGGLDLTAEGLGGKCFNVFIGDTRSSQSLTATLFDFSRGRLGECESDTVTTPLQGDGSAIPSGGLSIGAGSVTVKDRAVVTVTGVDDFGGDVTFSLCGPLALNSTSNCQTGGVQIGSPVPVSDPSPATVFSDVTTLTSVGRYCWRAVYSGDAATGVPGSSDPDNATSTTECFTVNPVTPTLTTQASGDVTLGNPISDTATLTGTASQPGTNGIGPGGTINATNGAPAGGSISWTAFGPNDCVTVAFGPTSRDVSGDNTYPTAAQAAVSFTPLSVGTYTFVASYSGSSPNTNGVGDTVCPDPTGAENVTVTDTSSVVTEQNWLPNDTATVSSAGGSPLTGTLTFTLFETADCTGTAVAGQTYTRTLTNATTLADRTKTTSNSTYFVTATKTVSWLVTFDSFDQNVADAAPVCEMTSLTIDNDVPVGP